MISKPHRNVFLFSIGGLIILLFFFSPSFVRGETEREYKVKAAFLFNFSQFVTWPSNRRFEETKGFHLCLYGDSPIREFLQQSVKGKKLHDHHIRFSHLHSQEDILTCHLLFIGSTHREWVTNLRKSLIGKPILTIAEFEQFSESGGMIQLFIENKKVRFAINPSEVDRAHLQMSSKLLQLAKIVGERES